MSLKKLTADVEEVSVIYTDKFNIERDADWFILKLQEELGELTQTYLMMKGKARAKGKSEAELKEDFEKEVADVLCHVLLLAKNNDIDLDRVIQEKWLSWKR